MVLPEIKVSVSFGKLKNSECFQINSSKDAAKMFRQIFDADTINWKEEFIILCLNNSNKVIGFHKLSSGGMTGTVVDVRTVFLVAIQSLATALIIAHNHPSGTLTPSASDLSITKKLKNGGNLLDIKILDHLIITDESYLSMADEGNL